MRRYRLPRSIPLIAAILLLVAASGCDEGFGNWSRVNRAQFKRTIARQIALDGRDTLDVFTRSGSVIVTGADVADCNVVATIIAHAPTEEEAQELAEQVEIVAEAAGSTVKIRAREPDPTNHSSTAISYTITIPRRMNVTCESRYGGLDVRSIEGRLDGRSGNGSIKAQDIQGPTDLNTSYGSIECRDVAGSAITLHSNNGSIQATGLRGPVTAESSYGAITCHDSSGGDLRLKSGNGRILLSNASFGLCEARSSYGAVGGKGLTGDAIGLHSGNGAVEVDEAQAKSLDLSSSYGSIRANYVAVASLKAVSGNGSIRIVCSPAAAADLDAQVRSSYGSIEFTPPPEFAGEVYLNTNYGTIKTAQPVTVSGEITKKRIVGTIGAGAGKLHLESGNGSIELK